MTYPPKFIDSMVSGKGAEKFRSFAVKCFFYNPLTRILLRSADKTLAANQETADLMEGMLGEPVGVMLETAYQVDGSHAVADEVRKGEEIRVLWVGGLMARKAPQIAIDAVREARKRGANASLDIVGSGPLKEKLEAMVGEDDKEWLVFHGQVQHERINEFFSRADLFLFTSLRDTSGNVVLEAMANSLPVVVPDHQGVAQICSAEHAILIPVKTPEQLLEGFTEAILKLSEDSELRRSMGDRSRERLLKHWSWDIYCQRMAAIYQECLEINFKE